MQRHRGGWRGGRGGKGPRPRRRLCSRGPLKPTADAVSARCRTCATPLPASLARPRARPGRNRRRRHDGDGPLLDPPSPAGADRRCSVKTPTGLFVSSGQGSAGGEAGGPPRSPSASTTVHTGRLRGSPMPRFQSRGEREGGEAQPPLRTSYLGLGPAPPCPQSPSFGPTPAGPRTPSALLKGEGLGIARRCRKPTHGPELKHLYMGGEAAPRKGTRASAGRRRARDGPPRRPARHAGLAW